MDITRKTFCGGLLGATVTLWLQGCGGGGGYGGGSSSGGGSNCGAAGPDISANHGHSLTIAKADLDSPVDKTYSLSNAVDGHSHDVTFTVAQLAQLKAGATVTITSTTTVATAGYGGSHNHQVATEVAVASCA